ncbi:MAG: vitamin K epoxide reductase family protein [Gammaproteobacteria bacterium]
MNAPNRTERKRERRVARDSAASEQARARRPPPGRIEIAALVLAGLGVALCGWLLAHRLGAAPLAFCAEGSGCDLVQASRFSTFLGLSLPAWGLAVYGGIGALVLAARRQAGWWPVAWLLAALGTALSLYYTVAAALELGTFCPWCLISLVLMCALAAAVTALKPAALAAFRWKAWAPGTAAAAVALTAVMHLGYAGAFDAAVGSEDPYLRALAEHLAGNGAKFYGAYWCPHCQEQKHLFGASAPRLPYVECNPNGRNGGMAPDCRAQNLQGYPTWIIGGRHYEEVIAPDRLARLTGFKAPPGAPSAPR